MNAMLKNVWRGSHETEFRSKTSRMLKLPAVTTRRLLSTTVPSCIGSDSCAMRRPPNPIVCSEERARPVELRRLRAVLLELEVLDRAADAVEIREGALGDHLGNDVRLAPLPEPQPEEEGEAARVAPLAVGDERVDACRSCCRVLVRRVKWRLVARDVRKLPVRVPALVLDVVQAVMRQEVHEVERLRPRGRPVGAAWARAGAAASNTPAARRAPSRRAPPLPRGLAKKRSTSSPDPYEM